MPNDSHKRKQYLVLGSQIVPGNLFALVAYYILDYAIGKTAHFFGIAEQYSIYATLLVSVISIILVGVGLFWIRGHYPLLYGTSEVAVGVLATINALARFKEVDSNTVIQIIGGIYIVVRGLDNIGRGVIGTSVEAQWRWLFRKT